MTHTAILLYTAELKNPTRPDETIMELDCAVELEWDECYERLFKCYDIFYTEEVFKNGVRWNRRVELPLNIRVWVRECIEADRDRIAKAIDSRWEDDVVSVPRTDGGRLTLAEPF